MVCGWQKRLLYGFAKNCGFWFGFTKWTVVSLLCGSVRPTFVCQRQCHLSLTPLRYDARNDVLPCRIGPTNCQPKWLRTRSTEIRHEEKCFGCWCYRVGRWIVNETPKLLKSVFWKLNCENWVFRFWILRSVRFGSVFRKPISDIFVGFFTTLNDDYY